MRLALYEPDIPQNAGALLRLGACLVIAVDIIEPCGFLFSDHGFRRAGMDYLDKVEFTRHASWPAFHFALQNSKARLVLLSRSGLHPYTEFEFRPDDTLLLGRETAGVPGPVRAAAEASVRIPLKPGLRSLNVAQAGAIVLGEALRQTQGFPA